MTEHKLALITGGHGGIGSAIARALAADGFDIAIPYRRDEPRARDIQQSIEHTSPGRCELYQADVTDRAQTDAMLETIAAKHGGVTVLVNAASAPALTKSFEETPASDFEEQFRVNVLAPVELIQKVLPFMKTQKEGIIVSVLTSYVFGVPPEKLAPYVSAKQALWGLTKVLARELGPSGIRVNAVSPGMTDTAFTAHIPDAYKKLLARQVPLGRLCAPEDVAAAVRFLCSDEARFITGVNIPITGGADMT